MASRSLNALSVIAACLVLSADSGSAVAAQRKSRHQKTHAVKLVRLRDIEPLQAAFQRDAGKIRLVTILSPT